MTYNSEEGTARIKIGRATFTFSAIEINGHAIVDSAELAAKFKMPEDKFLHTTKDYFDTVDDAALAWSLKYNQLSMTITDEFKNGREYCAYIYDVSTKNNTRYSFGKLAVGTSENVDLGLQDSRKKLVAWVHSHTAYRSDDDYEADQFSGMNIYKNAEGKTIKSGDGTYTLAIGVPGYVCTPGGYLKCLSTSWIRKNINAIPDNDPAVRIVAIGLPT